MPDIPIFSHKCKFMVVVEGVVEGALVIVSFTEVPFVDEPKNKTKIQKL